jgi:hypothetical protein
MCSIEIVPLSVRLFPIFSPFLHLENWIQTLKFEYKLRTMYPPGVWPEFLIRGLEVLGLGFLRFLNLNFLKTGIPVFNTIKNDVCTSFWQVSARAQLESTWKYTQNILLLLQPKIGSRSSYFLYCITTWHKNIVCRPNPRVQIFPPEYLGSHAL